MGKIRHQWGWFGGFYKMHNCSKVEHKKKLLIPKLVYLSKHSKRKAIFAMLIVEVGSSTRIRSVHV
jgi:hypothetical protein